MKGVLICGGSGTRLRPLTEITNKSLLPVYDKPLILYPLQVLLNAGIKEIAIVSGGEHMEQMAAFLGSGDRFGASFTYLVQKEPKGIAQALGLAETFSGGQSVCAILGDNVFFDDISTAIRSFKAGAKLFLKKVHDPERFGVATLKGDKVVAIEEKPKQPKTDMAVTGCYVYDNKCFEVVRNMKPSPRGELEITDVSAWYVKEGLAEAAILKDEWLDAGTFESLFRAAEFVRQRKGM